MLTNDGSEESPLLEFKNDTLTLAIKQKAQRELGESEEKIEENLKKLMEIMKGIENLNCQMDKAFLLKFLRAKKFDCEKAKDCLCRFYNHRKHYPHLYENLNPQLLEIVMDANVLNFSSLRTRAGCVIWITMLGKWIPTRLSSDDVFRFGNICMQKALDNPVTQICGIVSILDFRDYGWSHQLHLTIPRVYSYITAIQDAIPYRAKEFHIINHSILVTALFAIMKPFLKEKIRKKIFFHGSSLESLHKYVPPEALLREHGGPFESFSNDDFYNVLRQSQETCLSNCKFGFLRE